MCFVCGVKSFRETKRHGLQTAAPRKKAGDIFLLKQIIMKSLKNFKQDGLGKSYESKVLGGDQGGGSFTGAGQLTTGSNTGYGLHSYTSDTVSGSTTIYHNIAEVGKNLGG
tara:strand:+ start:264 stop:596 length:333 start_codon:yes stop_codon:yes gene_type:complete